MEAQPAYGVQPHELPSYLERVQSELPALHLLMQIGWQYLTPEEANRPGGRRA
jgi:type I restriction enzyme, R subunit